MTSLAPAPRRLVLADRVFPRHRRARHHVVVLGGTAFVAGLAQLVDPAAAGAVHRADPRRAARRRRLGPLRGAPRLGLYLVLGLVGLPVYAPQADGSHLTGATAFAAPSFGYIVGFVAAAAIVGCLSRIAWDRNVLKTLLSFPIGSLVIFAFGVAGLDDLART